MNGETDTLRGRYGMVGQSEPMQRVYSLLERLTANVASYAPTVVIHGERGTGKELVAKAIHHYGTRREKPFVAFNCAAVPETLLEAELFGSKRGAFTGAYMDRPGLFLQADGGTLFIDEITDMGLSMQTKLLRAMQEKMVRPIGGMEDVSYDAQIIVASSQSLEEAVREKRFRADLYDRLNMVRVKVPALRERGEDIYLLAAHFVDTCQKEAKKGLFELTPDARLFLENYPWHGNVRELGNIIYGIIALKPSTNGALTYITVQDFSERLPPVDGADLAVSQVSPRIVTNLHTSLRDKEREMILAAIESSGGIMVAAARCLGVTPRDLYRRMHKLGIRTERKTVS